MNGQVMPVVDKNDNGIRPAGKPNECFYCNQKVGTPHKEDCVVVYKKVKVKYSYEIEIEVPYGWDKEQIEFHRNVGSWCADNSVDELQELIEEGNCLCGCFEAEVLSIPDQKPYIKDKDGNIIL